MKNVLLVASAVAMVASAGAGGQDAVAPDRRAAMPVADPAQPGFASELAQDRPIRSAAAWVRLPEREIWSSLAHSRGNQRQRARWDYARSLIAGARAQEALGVLDVMGADDADLAMVDDWQLARGAALTLAHRPAEAIAALGTGGLPRNPEACAWRMRALADAGRASDALPTINCATAALSGRRLVDRTPFVLAAARATIEAGQPLIGLQWLSALADTDAAANVLRGRAEIALGRIGPARLRLDRALTAGDPATRAEATLGKIELLAVTNRTPPATLLRQLDQFRYGWRGDQIEARALRIGVDLGIRSHDLAATLSNGAALFRFHGVGIAGQPLLATLQQQLAAAIDPGSDVPIGRAAGLIWDYRDLLPGGADGDAIVDRFVDRLQEAGLYGRAAQLLEHRLMVRAVDWAQGPLSARVATLYIIAGQPARALRALRDSANPDYPPDMLVARRRVEAVALDQLGRNAEALAVLQDVPDGAAIRAELAWKHRDWKRVVAETEASLPTGPLGAVGQAIVLRRAIALAMLRQNDALATLNTRYRTAFAPLPSGPVFAALTAPDGRADPATFARAMAALPSVSPAGTIGDLIEND